MKVTSALMFVGLLFVSLYCTTEARSAKVDEAAPAFTLTDVDGNRHSLADFKGKYIVLEWVNYDCPFVRKHYASGNMQRLQREWTDKGVVWLSICSSAPGKQGYFETAELKDRIKEEKAVPSAYLLDSEGTVGKMYEAKTTPHMYIINPEGVLIYAGGIDNIASTNVDDIGMATNYVRATLEAAMAGKPVEVKGSRPYGCSVKYK
jgi:peroxiredoxin